MDEPEQVRAARQQRRRTLTAIRDIGVWARDHQEQNGVAFMRYGDLYRRSQQVDTVEELATIEDQAHAYLQQLQNEAGAYA